MSSYGTYLKYLILWWVSFKKKKKVLQGCIFCLLTSVFLIGWKKLQYKAKFRISCSVEQENFFYRESMLGNSSLCLGASFFTQIFALVEFSSSFNFWAVSSVTHMTKNLSWSWQIHLSEVVNTHLNISKEIVLF